MSDDPNRLDVSNAATVVKRNGAYLIGICDIENDASSDQTTDCASSLVKAKRIAREMVEAFDYEGPFRWHNDNGYWQLSAVYQLRGAE